MHATERLGVTRGQRLLAAEATGRPAPFLVACRGVGNRLRTMRDAAAMGVVPRPVRNRALFLGRWFRRRSLSSYGKTATFLTEPILSSPF